MMSRRMFSIAGLVLVALLASACPKGKAELEKGQQAELAKDYDGALIHYERALAANPNKVEYQLRAKRMRFEAAQMHVDRGHKLRDQGLLEPAAAEFEKALAIDPSSFVAEQELRRTLQLIVAQRRAEAGRATRNQQNSATSPPADALEGPTQLRPLARAPLTLKLTEDARRVFETIAKLAKINIIFDPDFQPRRITVQLQEATLEQALDIVALMTGTFWKPVTPNTIIVIPDTTAKRKAYEEQIIKTFYLSNTIQAAELNEIVQALRTLLDIRRITPSTSNNAIIIRDTPDKIAVAEKIIRDVDQAKPEVMIQVTILQARRDRIRDLGILPSTSVPLIFTPRGITGGDGDGASTAANALRLSDLDTLSSADYSIVLPSFTAMALLTDADTKIIQNPEIRTTDGQTAKLRIGDKVPFAVGSFQPGIGGVGINPLVNTQFQFQDVGVNVDITPRVHSNREISMRVSVEVSSVTGRVNIGGIEQPIFGQRTIEHDIRLREGEVSILGGIIERSETVSVQGWPGLSRIPGLRWLFSTERKELMENEILIVLTPRLVRMPAITAENLRALAVGTDEKVSLPRSRGPAPPEAEAQPAPALPLPPVPSAGAQPGSSSAPVVQGSAEIGFQPPQTRVAAGQQVAINVVLKNMQNLFAVPFALRFDPAVVELAEVHHGGFLNRGDQPAALVHRVDKETGTALISLLRPPASGGVSGDGALVTLVFRALAPGRTPLTIENIAARNALQETIEMRSSVGEILVE